MDNGLGAGGSSAEGLDGDSTGAKPAGRSGHHKVEWGERSRNAPGCNRGHTQETEMRDVVDSTTVSAARLTRGLDEHECRQRNALSRSIRGFALRYGDVGHVLEPRGDTEAVLDESRR